MSSHFHSIHITGKSTESVYIEVGDYLYSSGDADDLNWLRTQATVSCGAWMGRFFEFEARTEEFERFLVELEALYKTLKGEAAYQTMEDNLNFKLIGNGMGQIEVSGYAISSHVPRNRLEFNFEIDQTYLNKIISQVQLVVSRFPSRQHETS